RMRWRALFEYLKQPRNKVLVHTKLNDRFLTELHFVIIHNFIGINHQDQIIQEVHPVVVIVGNIQRERFIRINQFLNLTILQSITLPDLEEELDFLFMHMTVNFRQRQQIANVILLVRQILMFEKSYHEN